jgi:glycosyltransferase involved in cell wall biosynthesis
MTNHEAMTKPTICRVVTVPVTFSTLLLSQVASLHESGFAVTLVSSAGADLEDVARRYGMSYHGIEIALRISPLHDLVAFAKLWMFFRRNRFDIVHSITPKAGLLTALAGRMVGHQLIIHTFTGQAWVEMHGLRRHILKWSDKLVGFLTHQCYADSASQRDFLVAQRIVPPLKISIIGSGSISGVDLARFDSKKWSRVRAAKTKKDLDIPPNSLVVLFMGRFTQDKGVIELISAFNTIELPRKRVDLVLLGPLESDGDPLPASLLDQVRSNKRIHAVGFSARPEEYIGIADVFCLPSYREGFGSCVIEAAAMGVPAVVTDIVGLVDAVKAGETGILVPVKDATALRNALHNILADDSLRAGLGKAARERAIRLFDSKIINEMVAQEYQYLYSRNHNPKRSTPHTKIASE